MTKPVQMHDVEEGRESSIKPGTRRTDQMLLEFLRENEAAPPCPVCGYNLRDLTRPICPECKQELVLTVGVQRLGIAWLLAALVPGMFSGIAACFVAIPTVAVYFEDGKVVWPFAGAVVFGWCSGLFAIMLIVRRMRFIAQSRERQRMLAIIIWIIHAAVGLVFFGWVASQI